MISYKIISRPRAGFTAVELILVLALVAIAATVGVSILIEDPNAQRYEATRAKMEEIQKAIVGDPNAIIAGRRQNFGYVGDWGSLPAAISDLTTAAATLFSFSATYGFGAGWRGPYLSGAITGASATTDGWNRAWIWTPAGTPPTLVSRGADGAAGGTKYDQDITLELRSEFWQATVYGTVLNGTTPQAGVTVEIRYPVAGVITAATTTSAATGSFSFAAVPFGIRSIAITSNPRLGPQPLIVDNNRVQVTLNYSK